MKKLLKITTKKILILCFIIPFFAIQTTNAEQLTNAEQKAYRETLADGITQIKSLDGNNKINHLISTFCDTTANTYSKRIMKSMLFDAKQSLFMNLLCANTDEKKNTRLQGNLSTDLDKKTDSYWQFFKYENLDYPIISSRLITSANYDGNTVKYMDDIFNAIINNYTNIRQANIYGVIGDEDLSLDKQIDEFGKKYFPYNIDPKGPYIQICDKSNEKYNYPKTCSKLKDYFKSAKNILNNNSSVLNYKNIAKGENTNCTVTAGEEDKYNILKCGLYSDMTSFTNLVYNELFFYNLFSEYYSYALASDPNLQNDEEELSYKIAIQTNKITKLQNNKIRSQKAISMSIRMLKEIQNTFPFHIGFMMYAEDIYYLAQEINKTLTPIYTLYDLFRNVQTE